MRPTNVPSPDPHEHFLLGWSDPPLTRDERAANFASRGAALFFALAIILFFFLPVLTIRLAPGDHRSLGEVILWVLLVPAVPQVVAVWEAGVGWRHERARWGGAVAVTHLVLAAWFVLGMLVKWRC